MRRALIGMMTIVASAVSAPASDAQVRDSVRPQGRSAQREEPACCAIVRIDVTRRIVTAREGATGFTFRFDARSRRVLETLKVGQPVWADFANRTVRLKAADTRACCAILPPGAP